MSRLRVLWAVTFACELVTVPASAEGAVRTTPDVSSNGDSAASLPALYSFQIKAPDMKRRIEIRSANDEAIARCVGSCTLSLPEGQYVAVNYDADGAKQELEFTVEGPGGLELRDRNSTAAAVGLTLGVTGPIIILAGFVMVMDGFSHSCLMSECEPSRQVSYPLGWVATAAGMAMTPIGWVLYARNRQPRWKEISGDLSVTVAPNRDGALFGLSGRF